LECNLNVPTAGVHTDHGGRGQDRIGHEDVLAAMFASEVVDEHATNLDHITERETREHGSQVRARPRSGGNDALVAGGAAVSQSTEGVEQIVYGASAGSAADSGHQCREAYESW
jgi:hypothetical protein